LTKRLLSLIAGCAALWLVLGFPAYYLDGELGLAQSAAAAVLCLVPTTVTLLWCDLVVGKSPELQLAAVLGGTGIRMAFVVGIGLVMFLNLPVFHSPAFWIWIVVFYLGTLTLEIVLVVKRQAAMDRRAKADGNVFENGNAA
jgi:ABC-type multidrug transport system permease subunit